MEFNILNEKNEFKLGTIITVFSLPNTPKEIVIFSVGDYDSSDTASLEVAYLNKDKDGYNYIEEIDDDKVLKEAPEAKNIKAGSAVKILPGATYVSGKSIPEYIREKTWYVKYVGNGNACLGRSTDNKYNLFTEVSIKYLKAVSDPNKIVAGVGVRILPGAKYPSGKEIPVEVRKKWWYVKYVANGKACLDWSVDGTQRLFTEIPIKYLERYPE